MQPHIRAFVERAVTFTTCPECGGTRLSEAARSSKIKGISIADACAMQISDLADVGARPRRAVGGAAAGGAAAHPRLVRRDRAGLPLARPAVGHAVGRRGAAHQDDPPPRLVAHRRHLRLRRADDRAAPPRHPADERPAAAAARQGQHRARRGAQAGGDRDRRPRRRPRPRRRHAPAARWCSRAPSRGCGPAARSPAGTSTTAPRSRPTVRTPTGALEVRGADDAQPAGRRRRHPARRAGRRHRRGRLGQELADPRLGGRPGRRGGGRPGRRSAARGGATRRPTPGCSTRSARRSRRPTA